MNQLLPNPGGHARQPWRPTDPPDIWVHCSLAELRGTHRRSLKDAKPYLDRYVRAKKHFDMAAAVEVVAEVVNQQVLDLTADALLASKLPVLIALPHPEFDAGDPGSPFAELPNNALPFAFANYLAADLGCEVDEDIVQRSRHGRTELGLFPRLLWQPSFEGEVRRDRAYILADDVSTIGGTLAMLRSYIVTHGGTVIAVTSLASGAGRHQKFGIAEQTVRELKSQYGDQLDDLLRGEVGHDCECLTEVEGSALVRWGKDHCRDCGPGSRALQRLRDRLAEAAAKAS